MLFGCLRITVQITLVFEDSGRKAAELAIRSLFSSLYTYVDCYTVIVPSPDPIFISHVGQ